MNPESIITQVAQNTSPSPWRVFPGRAHPLRSGAFVLVFCLCIFTLVISFNGFLAENNDIMSILRYIWGDSIYIVVASIICGSLAVYSDIKKKDSLLVLLPEGVVVCSWYSRPTKRSYKILNYRDLAVLSLKAPTSSSTSSANTQTIESKQYNGTQASWHFDSRFGAPIPLIEEMIKAHADFTALSQKNEIPM